MIRFLTMLDRAPWWSSVVMLTTATLVAYVVLERALTWWEGRR